MHERESKISDVLLAIRAHDYDTLETILEKIPNPEILLNVPYGPLETSLLMEATSKGNLQIVKYLISKGADINQCDRDGNNPLIRAATWNHDEIIEYLVSSAMNGFQLGSAEFKLDYQVAIMSKENVHKAVIGGQRKLVNQYLIPVLDGENLVPIKDLINIIVQYIF